MTKQPLPLSTKCVFSPFTPVMEGLHPLMARRLIAWFGGVQAVADITGAYPEQVLFWERAGMPYFTAQYLRELRERRAFARSKSETEGEMYEH